MVTWWCVCVQWCVDSSLLFLLFAINVSICGIKCYNVLLFCSARYIWWQRCPRCQWQLPWWTLVTKEHVLVFVGRRSCPCTSYRVRKPCSCYHFFRCWLFFEMFFPVIFWMFMASFGFACAEHLLMSARGSWLFSCLWKTVSTFLRGSSVVQWHQLVGNVTLTVCMYAFSASWRRHRLSTLHWYCVCMLFLRLGEGIVTLLSVFVYLLYFCVRSKLWIV